MLNPYGYASILRSAEIHYFLEKGADQFKEIILYDGQLYM